MAKSIVLIHGAWVTPSCWDLFRSRLESFRFKTQAPAWPGFERTPVQLRAAPPRGSGGTTLGLLVDHYAKIVGELSEPPILIGHAAGGLIVQHLLDRGLGAAGVALAPIPAGGVRLGLAGVSATLRTLLRLRGRHGCVVLAPDDFADNMAHTLTPEEQEAAYAQYIAPAPAAIVAQSVFGLGCSVNFENPARPPLLLIAGEEDRIVLPNEARQTQHRYERAGVATPLQMLSGRTHWLIASPGWQEVVDTAVQWMNELSD